MAHLYPLPTKLKFVFFFDVSAFTLWFCCFGRLLILLPLVGRRFLPGGIADFFHVVSLLPLSGELMKMLLPNKTFNLKDLWSVLNSVKNAWICYGVIFPHPKVAKHTSYSLLILSWCLMYVIHYGYCAFKTKTRRSPWFLFWLEYHHFYITVPLATAAEMTLIFLSLNFVPDNSPLRILVSGVLMAYVPVTYIFWGHLVSRKNTKYNYVMERRHSRPAPSRSTRPDTQANSNTPSIPESSAGVELQALDNRDASQTTVS
ncbi:Piso0_002934 [Millerozyma farinosa CBS 7064]|uniref:very-long-chain (3R)-3-hydroxyacyl-CoA dehydratase n=1 Tax=Pichia sorbitophila (strain ATCC MYA-4447 / BCRC 22081 / CBS 7064 / NBRC 10061 / NRRL Y-12695) TaxID=559304 RepID=G8YJW3_PICSO|nr:Piso0_002934 [Millerozyma farinosa CBS 7064]CCE80608.1 Piso0_002934 [Millerozyma farinosa CBS 7064]